MSNPERTPVITEEEEEEEIDSEEELDESYEPDDLTLAEKAREQGEGSDQEEEQTDDAAKANEDKDGKKKSEPEVNPMTLEHLYGNSLTMLRPIGQGLSCAYVRMDIPNRGITDVAMLENYIHLRYLDVSQNHLQDIRPICAMTNLVSFNASKNRLRQLQLESLPYLQTANLANNKLTSFEGLSHPQLEKLNLSGNRIRNVRFFDASALLNLSILDLRGNKLETLEGTYPPNLQELYAPANLLRTVGKMSGVENLKILHLRDNQLENLDGIDESGLSSLTYINLRGNNLEEYTDLKKLRSITTLTDVALEGNPLSESDDYRDMALGAMGTNPNIQRLDKERLIPEDFEYAREAMEKLDAQPEDANEEELSNGYHSSADKSTSANLGLNLHLNLSEQ